MLEPQREQVLARPPEQLVLLEEVARALAENHTLVRFALASADQGTQLTLTLSDFAEPAIRPHANLYWGPTLQILKAVCERP